jgi:hypothetical protein
MNLFTGSADRQSPDDTIPGTVTSAPPRRTQHDIAALSMTDALFQQIRREPAVVPTRCFGIEARFSLRGFAPREDNVYI